MAGEDVLIRIATRSPDGTGEATGWVTVSQDQLARILQIVNENPWDAPELEVEPGGPPYPPNHLRLIKGGGS